MTLQEREEIRKEAWDKALHAYGTSYLYELRYKKYTKYLNALTYFGFAVPLTVGAVFMG